MTERSGGFGLWVALLVGALLLALAVVLYAAYGRDRSSDREVDVAIDLPTPKMPLPPDAPRLPELPIPTPK